MGLPPKMTELRRLAAKVHNLGGRSPTRDRLLEEVLGVGISVTDPVIDNHVVALRKKIEVQPNQPR